jgi:hypothetical protein
MIAAFEVENAQQMKNTENERRENKKCFLVTKESQHERTTNPTYTNEEFYWP